MEYESEAAQALSEVAKAIEKLAEAVMSLDGSLGDIGTEFHKYRKSLWEKEYTEGRTGLTIWPDA